MSLISIRYALMSGFLVMYTVFNSTWVNNLIVIIPRVFHKNGIKENNRTFQTFFNQSIHAKLVILFSYCLFLVQISGPKTGLFQHLRWVRFKASQNHSAAERLPLRYLFSYCFLCYNVCVFSLFFFSVSWISGFRVRYCAERVPLRYSSYWY